MAGFRRTPAHQILSAKLGQRCYQVGLLLQPPAIHRDHEIAVAGERELERVCPLALAPAVPGLTADIDLVRRRLIRPAPSCVHHNRHGLISDQSDGRVSPAVRQEVFSPGAASDTPRLSGTVDKTGTGARGRGPTEIPETIAALG